MEKERQVEDELFDLETFTSLRRLPGQTGIERLALRSPLKLCLLNPIFLDYHISDEGGYNSCFGP